jgi:8-oxo-dGTP diphosphatase
MQKHDQGFDRTRYKVIVRSLIFIVCQDEVLLIKGAPTKKIWPNLFNGIGGHVEKGEDILSSARRELFEETGIRCDSLENKGSIMIDLAENDGILIMIFTGSVKSKEIESTNEGDLYWIPVTQVQNYPLVEDLYTLLPKIFDPKTKYISGCYHFEKDQLMMRFS